MNEHGASTSSNELAVRRVIESWAETTRSGQQDRVLQNHADDVLIYDVLLPMKYEGAAAYRSSWDDWQPQTTGEGVFELQDLSISAGSTHAFAHGFILCGGTMPNGKTFSDTVRANFCLQWREGRWQVVHQHISKPLP